MGRPEPLSGAQSWWLLILAAATLGPHLPDLPPWLAVLVASLLAIQALRTGRRQAPPPRWLVALAALGAAGGIALSFHQIFGKDPGVALLAVLLTLKLLEGRSRRDARAAVLLALFLQVALFLNSQSPAVGAWAVVGAALALAALASLQQPGGPGVQLRLAGLLLAQGLPFMLALFVLFPRVQGPLWGLPEDAHSATTGLSDDMSPGSISQLARSDAIALRARFAGEPPPRSQLYWRGPVLERFDGRSWKPGEERTLPAPAYTPAGSSYAYQLTLEPHGKSWLLALDFPAPGLAGVRYASDLRLLAAKPLHSRQRFDLVSRPATPVGLAETPETLQAALQLPAQGNARARELGRQLRERRTKPEAIVEAAAAYFRDARLTYTLSPPILPGEPVDGFLFETRRGFCEHFASAFAFVLRAAGVPARVVTGYQGGEINPVDQVMEVRQSDAHAWTEAWLAGRGWVRLDPTALAAPSRTEGSLADTLGAGEPLPYLLRTDLAWLRALRHRWDAVNNAWNQWVLGYTPERQRDLLSRLGLGEMDWQRLATLLAVVCGLLLCALILWALRGHASRDPLERCWQRFCARLARAGLPRLPWEGPLAYAERAALAFPRHAEILRGIARSYARQRYGGTPSAADLKSLARRIRNFRPT